MAVLADHIGDGSARFSLFEDGDDLLFAILLPFHETSSWPKS
jgi:hypothetical protein